MDIILTAFCRPRIFCLTLVLRDNTERYELRAYGMENRLDVITVGALDQWIEDTSPRPHPVRISFSRHNTGT